MYSRVKSNAFIRKLHMSGVLSSRIVKLSYLRVRLSNLLIQRKSGKSKFKWKTVTRLANITGRAWWFTLNIISLIRQKIMSKK